MNRNGLMKKGLPASGRLRKIRKAVKWFLLLYLIYLIAGALLPFLFQKKTGEPFKAQFRAEAFYGEELTGQEENGTNKVCTDRARVVETSMDALESRIQMIHQATDRIILSTFDIREGESCRDIFSSLLEAADRGVKVQVLVDGLYGSVHMNGNPIFYAAGTHPNIEIKFYNIPSLLKPWTVNGRMHDKYVIVDDKLLLLGGRNTFDYFLGEYNLKNLSYDRDVLIYNTAAGQAHSSESVIFQVEDYFNGMWDSKYCKAVFDDPSESMKKEIPAAREELAEHYEALCRNMAKLLVPEHDYAAETVPIRKATLIYNPTHIMAKEPWVWYQVQALMAGAKERAYIHTPYAVLSKDMYQGLREIVQNVPEVTMLLNATSVGDNVMASSDYTRNREKILDTGVSLREYFGDHSSHGKSILIDDRLSLVGSYNLDMRSTYIDTETMLVIDGEEFNRQLEACILGLEESSLVVNRDGTYVTDTEVPVVELSEKKKRLFAITSRLFQLIRYLI